MKLLAPSILSADFWDLKTQIEAVIRGGADLIHFDVMDGHFVPNITVGPYVLECIKKRIEIPIDAHLMIENADKYISEFISAGADWISVHIENNYHIHRTIEFIKKKGAKAGVVINPGTSLDLLKEIVHYVDYVLLMSVNPGFGGQKFIERSVHRLRDLVNLRDITGTDFLIEIDGGIKEDNIGEVVRAGADVVVVGSGIFFADDIENQTRKLKNIILSSTAV